MAARGTASRRGADHGAARAGGRRSGRTGGAVAAVRHGRQAGSIASLQRARLIDAAVGLLAEDGYEGFSAAAVCERAGVSRRTFYEVFEGREACLSALLGSAEQRVSSAIAEMGLGRLDWGERIRMGLWAILCIADSDPALARACLVESQRAGAPIQSQHEQIVKRLAEQIDEGRLQSPRAAAASELTAEALVGAVTSVIATRMRERGDDDSSRGSSPGLRGLLGELTAMIVLPYLGPAAARRERGRPLPSSLAVGITQAGVGTGARNPLVGLPIRLTYRTACILQAVAALTADGTRASNRKIAEHAGISDQGQASKLLSRLQQHRLLENTTQQVPPRGEANNWLLTPAGKQLLHAVTARDDHTSHSKERGWVR